MIDKEYLIRSLESLSAVCLEKPESDLKFFICVAVETLINCIKDGKLDIKEKESA